jgi:hemerythrin-like domain-containing protein
VTKRPDAITVLVDDHRAVDALFKRFEKASEGAVATRRDLASQMIRELSIHAAIEEQLFYPRLRATGKGMKDDVLEALEEHHVAKELLAEIEKLPPDNERFAPKVKVLIETVRHHIEEEESDLFPRARKALREDELVEIGEGLQALKTLAPTHPHPHAPDEPPANLANLGVAGLDRLRDVAGGAVEMTGRVVQAAREAVARRR